MSFLQDFSSSVSQIGRFWQEKVNAQIFRWNIVLILLQFGILFLKFGDLPPQVPLYYSLPWGESQLSPVFHIFLLPTLSVIIVLLNNCLAVFFLKSSQLLSRLLIVTSLVFSAFSVITLLQIISLVT